MGIVVKPSDLKYKYPRGVETRDLPKFRGKPDPAPFNRDDLYEILPMMEAVLDEVRSNDGRLLNHLEDLLNHEMPRFVATREEVFDFLTFCAKDIIADGL